MALDNKNVIIDRHLKDLEKNKRSAKKNLMFLIGGVVLVSLVGFVSFGNPLQESVATPDLPIERWEIEEKPKSVLVSTESIIEEEIIAVINPTAEQMERLKRKKEGRKIIRENRKRARKADIEQIKLTSGEMNRLKNAGILGTNDNIFSTADLKPAKGNEHPLSNNAKVGISDETYSAEEVKGLHMVGYVRTADSGEEK